MGVVRIVIERRNAEDMGLRREKEDRKREREGERNDLLDDAKDRGNDHRQDEQDKANRTARLHGCLLE